nr:MAG TPA: hypothetical protein [Caudoviricetes sp.]
MRKSYTNLIYLTFYKLVFIYQCPPSLSLYTKFGYPSYRRGNRILSR